MQKCQPQDNTTRKLCSYIEYIIHMSLTQFLDTCWFLYHFLFRSGHLITLILRQVMDIIQHQTQHLKQKNTANTQKHTTRKLCSYIEYIIHMSLTQFLDTCWFLYHFLFRSGHFKKRKFKW
jgi:citrate lyase alpha subunit